MAIIRRKSVGIEPVIVDGPAEVKLSEISDGTVQATITSPPYYRQKDYHVPTQIGWESSVGKYIDKLKLILADLWRVTSPSGSCFFVVGDTYVNKSLQLVPQRLAIAASEAGWPNRKNLFWQYVKMPDSKSDERYGIVYSLVGQLKPLFNIPRGEQQTAA